MMSQIKKKMVNRGRTATESGYDLSYVVSDFQRSFLRMADNLRWYEQTWLGVPIWQLPDDLIALQRIVFDTKPKWIVETGTKFGGSAIFFGSLLAMMGHHPSSAGVITVDIEETKEAKQFLDEQPHKFAEFVRNRLIGDAKSESVLGAIRRTISSDPGTTLVFLDDWHDGDHVYEEMSLYAKLITPGSFMIVADTTFEDLADTPILSSSEKYPNPKYSNPRVAVRKFIDEKTDFEIVLDYTNAGVSNFPDGVLRRIVFSKE